MPSDLLEINFKYVDGHLTVLRGNQTHCNAYWVVVWYCSECVYVVRSYWKSFYWKYKDKISRSNVTSLNVIFL